MRAPEFWGPGKRGHALACVLSPLGTLYGALGRLRAELASPTRVGVPVICVGNLIAGGAGKTPVVMALLSLANTLGAQPHALTRGYGGTARGPLRVDPARHDASMVGDEALLLANAAPTWVSRDRVAGAKAAIDAGARLIVMDDGFQNPYLEKDLAFLVVDGGYGFGNRRLIPAGPLREPVARGMARARAIVLIGPDTLGLHRELSGYGRTLLEAELVPGAEALHYRERPVVAFAGIGRPAKFFASLEASGALVVERHAFPDHHRYKGEEIMRLCEAANRHGGYKPVTTLKDYVRLPPEARLMVDVLSVDLVWREPDAVRQLLARLIQRS
ncbi:MAG: tetraacyldisaccharide 4'-kinase [Alphaproteobacteria bacterium]|nr:tetraacyldisaccharide 4'-kinase [Alphaproteobacteria bacterium]